MRFNLDKTILTLIVANFIVFAVSGFIGFNGDIAAIQKETLLLESRLPHLNEQKKWVKLAKDWVANPPATNAGQFLGRLNQLAMSLKLEMTEASQKSGIVPEIRLSGVSNFNNISVLLNSISTEKATLPKDVILEQKSEGLWRFSTGFIVRTGEWKSIATSEKAPLPTTIISKNTVITSSRPFDTPVVKQVIQAPKIKERIRYIGYFAEQGSPTVILEISGKFAVLKCGETTTGGTLIKSATDKELHLVTKDSYGKEELWTVLMEKK